MDDLVKFVLRKNDKGRQLLFVTFSNREFTMGDEDTGRKIIEKYGKILQKFSNLYIIIDTRQIKSVSPGLGWNLITDLITYNDIARKNIIKTAILWSSKTLKKFVIDPILCVYNFVVPTEFFEKNDEALEYVQN
jgi:hypothetical protein